MNKDKIVKILINYISLPILGIVVFFMLTAFINRVFINPPIDNELEGKGILKNEAIQVNILNGCGEKGVADKFRQYLRLRGFDVVEIGNYNSNTKNTLVLDRLGDKRSCIKVAHSLGLHDSTIIKKIDSSLYLRATLIIGKDYRNFINLDKATAGMDIIYN